MTDDHAWFSTRLGSSVRDFFDVCDQSPGAFEAAARALACAGGTLPAGSVERQVAEARDRLRSARAGCWRPYEQHLASLGARYSRSGLALSAWHGIATRFQDAVVARAVATFAGQAARLTAVLVVVGEYLERSLRLIASDYDAAHPQREAGARARAEDSLAIRAHAFDHAALGIVVSDPVTRRIIDVNPAYAQLLGYEPHELIGMSGADLVAPASRAALRELEPAVGEPRHGTCDLRLRRKGGASVPVSVAWRTAELRAGTMMRVSAVTDTTSHEQLEHSGIATQRALERGAARLEIVSTTAHEFAASSGNSEDLLGLVARRLGELLGDSCSVRLISDDGAWLEPNTTFFHRDPAIRELTKHVFGTERQRLGEGVAGRVAQTGIPALIPVIDAAQAQAITAPAFRAVIGRIGLSSAMAIPLRSRGRTIGAISLLRSAPGNPYTIDDQYLAQDLADRAGLAIDNAVLVTTLEQRVIARTAALELANRELEAFSYSVSHDLRTPLRAIDGFSRALLSDYESVLDADGQRYLQRIRAATQRMSALIDDLLNLARISRGPVFLETHDLSVLASEVIAEIQRHEPARTMQVHIAPGLSARADARLLRIMLENLLGNAWKFTARHAEAEIWVGAAADAFYVRDTGAGFDMAYAEKLFVPFQRLHAAKDYDGSGIGLATVHRIVTHHGGRIWAEAEIGKGATFFFTLGGSHGSTEHSPGRRQ